MVDVAMGVDVCLDMQSWIGKISAAYWDYRVEWGEDLHLVCYLFSETINDSVFFLTF